MNKFYFATMLWDYVDLMGQQEIFYEMANGTIYCYIFKKWDRNSRRLLLF